MLDVRGLSVVRGGVPVLANLTFSLSAGQALILRGPNGAGKTTLLRTLAGLQPPHDGTVTGGEHIAYAAHSDGVKTMLSVEENLAFWANVFGTRDVENALAAFQLESLRARMAGTLSAGQRRRLGLARMLVSGRKVWAMDEPTVSLDAAAVALFANAIRDHLNTGGAALIATHIDLGLPEAEVLDVSGYRAEMDTLSVSDEAFL